MVIAIGPGGPRRREGAIYGMARMWMSPSRRPVPKASPRLRSRSGAIRGLGWELIPSSSASQVRTGAAQRSGPFCDGARFPAPQVLVREASRPRRRPRPPFLYCDPCRDHHG